MRGLGIQYRLHDGVRRRRIVESIASAERESVDFSETISFDTGRLVNLSVHARRGIRPLESARRFPPVSYSFSFFLQERLRGLSERGDRASDALLWVRPFPSDRLIG